MDYVPPSEPQYDQSAIVVTASRLPQPIADSAASVAQVDAERVERLGEPVVAVYLRLLPSVSVATSGPMGSFTQMRIRGAEANHVLLFVDGIRVNDPAAGNAPRFELLSADIASRIELVRGPQSALWGSEAVGGVIAVNGDAALTSGASAEAEAGAFGFRRAAGSVRFAGERLGVALAIGRQQAEGIDAFDGNGDKDGFTNTALRGLARWQAAPKLALTASGLSLAGRSDFDGFDPLTFLRADTRDRSRNRLAAGRIAARYGEAGDAWGAQLSGSLLGSRNVNLLGQEEVNRTRGRRATVEGQAEHRFTTGKIDHALILAASVEDERFIASDVAFGGFSDQSRSRRHWAVTGEWRGTVAERLIADVALRRDGFNRFRDATTVRGSLLFKATKTVTAVVSYGAAIGQPSFFDLYGFFPGSFVGNPGLEPETSRGFEAGLRYRKGPWSASLTAYRQNLRNEIVERFDFGTFLSSAVNAQGTSKRKGIEGEVEWRRGEARRLSATYALLDASEPRVGAGQLREQRRPRHSGSVVMDGASGRLSYGASLAYVGRRIDTDFDRFERVGLSAYWLAGARIAYRVHDKVELFGRVSNAFDQKYQDVVGYRTEGRAAYAGLRLAVDR